MCFRARDAVCFARRGLGESEKMAMVLKKDACRD